MQAATQYRAFADECDRLAAQAKTQRHRQVLKEMATVWRELAQETERKAESLTHS